MQRGWAPCPPTCPPPARMKRLKEANSTHKHCGMEAAQALRRPSPVRRTEEPMLPKACRPSTEAYAMNRKLIVHSRLASSLLALGSAACAALAPACSANTDSGTATSADALRGVIGPEGGELLGQTGSALEGVHLVVPAGAVATRTEITVRPADSGAPLPKTAARCGPEFAIEPEGLTLAAPATVTLPFDEGAVTDHYRLDDDVKIWALQGGTWGQRLQTASTTGRVTFQLDSLLTVAAGVNPPAESDIVHFDFTPISKEIACFAASPNDPDHAPTVHADVVRGPLNDTLFLRGRNIKPNLQFDLFTVEHSALAADGTPDPNFKGFGLAWYQTDLQADETGSMRVAIRTILLDQIFGFDPTVNLPPTGTFEVGFWFNNPQDAAACGFDVTKPTPFNGEHKAGPLAMITVPDVSTGLGPLCTKPDTSVTPAQCSP
jgi:hypothetical protein